VQRKYGKCGNAVKTALLLVDEFIANGIEPVATLYHWDLPRAGRDRGDWETRDTANAFADSGRILLQKTGIHPGSSPGQASSGKCSVPAMSPTKLGDRSIPGHGECSHSALFSIPSTIRTF
jgi:glycosyl hydrolase family 1